jgi:hypothetical protein
MAYQTNRFKRGSGCFACGVCGRKTRDAGDNGNCGTCPECFEVSGIENGISDGYYPTPEDLAKAESEIARLNQMAVTKGGTITGYSNVAA